MNTIKILAINSSPIKKGNTSCLLDAALDATSKEKDIAIERIDLAGLKISDCIHCNWCMRKQTPDNLCSIADDAERILQQILACDVLLLVSPVYFARLSGTMACLIDRTRCFIFGKTKHLALRGKVGIAMTVAWTRNGGIETTLESMHNAFLLHEMWTPSVHAAGAIFGVGAVSGQMNEDLSYKTTKLGVMEDREAIRSAGLLIRKAIKTARQLKSAT